MEAEADRVGRRSCVAGARVATKIEHGGCLQGERRVEWFHGPGEGVGCPQRVAGLVARPLRDTGFPSGLPSRARFSSAPAGSSNPGSVAGEGPADAGNQERAGQSINPGCSAGASGRGRRRLPIVAGPGDAAGCRGAVVGRSPLCSGYGPRSPAGQRGRCACVRHSGARGQQLLPASPGRLATPGEPEGPSQPGFLRLARTWGGGFPRPRGDPRRRLKIRVGPGGGRGGGRWWRPRTAT